MCEACFQKNEELRRGKAKCSGTTPKSTKPAAVAAAILDGSRDKKDAAAAGQSSSPAVSSHNKDTHEQFLESGATHSSHQDHQGQHDCSDCSGLMQRVDQLTSIVEQQRELISKLSVQLNFVLSYLDISVTEASSEPPAARTPSDAELEAETAINTTQKDAPALSAMLRPPVKSFADVVRQTVTAASQEMKINSSQEYMAAMYVEQANKARRANSFVVAGLQVSSQQTDNQLVELLCRDEFGLEVKALSCKRIGRRVADKPRNLLVYVQSNQQAQEIVGLAKTLRRSTNVAVRTGVFINPNLTKAEAKAQFEMRQKRRQQIGVRREEDCSTSGPTTSGDSTGLHAVQTAPDAQQAGTAAARRQPLELST
jgi:hypothetical protein